MDAEELIQDKGNEELWAHVFGVGAADLLDQRKTHARLPSPPRCRLCKAPFGCIGGAFLLFRGKKKAKRNPHYCSACDTFLEANPGGAEVPMALLYADIRGSTKFVHDHSPQEVMRRTNRFLDLATQSITDQDGFLLAFYGDCVFANWPPGFSGPDYVEKAMASARDLANACKEVDIPVGIGVHSGEAYMCSVLANKGTFRDVSVFGEAVNLVARLSDHAAPGEVMASDAFASAGNFESDEVHLQLKGFDAEVIAHKIIVN